MKEKDPVNSNDLLKPKHCATGATQRQLPEGIRSNAFAVFRI